MSNLLQILNAGKSYGTKKLFDDAQFSINEGEHVGVIGPNGAGKTTLFKILTDQDTFDSGTVVRSRNLRLGYLAQHDQWQDGQTIEDFLSHGCVKPLWELKSLATGLGIDDAMFDRPIQSFSGGYRMRVKLLYLIGQDPNVMLLDEPTNYLDLETTLVLENFLQSYEGAFLLISHDREFLRRTTDHVLEIESGEMTKYNGNLDDYFEQKQMLRSQLEAKAMSDAEKRAEIMDFVRRFGAKATKAKQAQSRLKSLERMETIELKALPVTARIKLPPPVRTGKIIAQLDNLVLGYGEKIVLHDVNLRLNNGDHLAVVGLNGAGKSTFLKAIADVLPPLKGRIERGMNVTIGYYAQHVAESLDARLTVLGAMGLKAHHDVTEQDVLNMAGSLLFSGDDVKKKVSVLSGGEKSRVALGQILLQKAPCLILDEPTNHLDFQTVEALTQALMAYEGTLVVVSHDRSFIRRVGTKVLEINHGEVMTYLGSYDDYVWSLQHGVLAERASNAPTVSSAPVRPTATPTASQLTGGVEQGSSLRAPEPFTVGDGNYKEQKKNFDRELRACERNLSQLEASIEKQSGILAQLNEKLSHAAPADLVALAKAVGDVQTLINTAEEQWLDFSHRKTEVEEKLRVLTGAEL